MTALDDRAPRSARSDGCSADHAARSPRSDAGPPTVPLVPRGVTPGPLTASRVPLSAAACPIISSCLPVIMPLVPVTATPSPLAERDRLRADRFYSARNRIDSSIVLSATGRRTSENRPPHRQEPRSTRFPRILSESSVARLRPPCSGSHLPLTNETVPTPFTISLAAISGFSDLSIPLFPGIPR